MKRVDYWLLGTFAALGVGAAVLARAFPPSTGSGLAIGLPWADVVLKLGWSAVFGLAITRAYSWRRRPIMAALFGGVWFVMTAGAAHIPAAWLDEAYVGAVLLVVGAFGLDLAWRNGDRRQGGARGPDEVRVLK